MTWDDVLSKVIANAEEDRELAKKRGNCNLAVYFQGKIVACNEIRALLSHGE